MKGYIIAILLLLLLTGTAAASPAEQAAEGINLLDPASLEGVNAFIRNINSELSEEIPLLNIESVKNIAEKGLTLDWQQVWRSVSTRFFREVAANIHLMGKLIFLAVLCSLLQNLQNSFEKSSISLLAYSLCGIFLAVIALTAFANAVALARTAVDQMVGFIEALLPLLISLLAAVGSLTTAALLTPLMLFLVSAVSVVVKDLVLPFLFLTAVLECINYLTDKYHLSNLAGVFKQAGMVVLGLAMVVFVGVISIQGAAGSVADGIALRTAKYATATFIPVVGKIFSDTVELVMGASLVVKNAVGIFGVLALMSICAFPLIKLMALVFIMKITGALIQPMGDEKMAKCLDALGNNLMLVFGAVLTVALMFFLAVVIIIGAGSVATMMR